MEYLYKFYYKYTDRYKDEVNNRINSPSKISINFKITTYKKKEQYNLYFIPTLKMFNLVSDIYNKDNDLKRIAESLPNVAKDAFYNELIIDELFSTNEIEGVKSTKAEIAESIKSIKEKNKKTKIRFKSMIKSYLNIIYDDNKLPKTSEDIRKIYDNVASDEVEESDKLDGAIFRENEVNIVTSTQKVIHQGIMGHENIVNNINNLLDFLHNEDDKINQIIKIAISHYLFGYIHPFYDGNGRTSRYINSLFLNHHLSKMTAISLSRSIDNNKKEYYNIFDKTNDPINKGELNYFIDTFLKFIKEGQKHIYEELNLKKIQLEEAINIIKSDSKLKEVDDYKKDIMLIIAQNFYFSRNEGVTVQEISQYINSTDQTSRKHLKELVDMEIINVIESRPKLYIAKENYFDA